MFETTSPTDPPSVNGDNNASQYILDRSAFDEANARGTIGDETTVTKPTHDSTVTSDPPGMKFDVLYVSSPSNASAERAHYEPGNEPRRLSARQQDRLKLRQEQGDDTDSDEEQPVETKPKSSKANAIRSMFASKRSLPIASGKKNKSIVPNDPKKQNSKKKYKMERPDTPTCLPPSVYEQNATTANFMEADFDEYYKELAKYQKKFGDCVFLSPEQHLEDGKIVYYNLSLWTKVMRKSKINLTNKQIKKLDDINFDWESAPRSSGISPFEQRVYNAKYAKQTSNIGGFSNNHKRWEAMFKKLLIFKEEYGHCNVPVRWKRDPALGKWVSRQRDGHNPLSATRKERLDEIGFTWRMKDRGGRAVPMSERYERKTQDEIKTQDTRYMVVGKIPPNLVVKNPPPEPYEERWIDKYQRLVRFYKKTGHTNVPFDYSRDPALGRWVRKQRASYGQGILRKDRIYILEKINFKWTHHDALADAVNIASKDNSPIAKDSSQVAPPNKKFKQDPNVSPHDNASVARVAPGASPATATTSDKSFFRAVMANASEVSPSTPSLPATPNLKQQATGFPKKPESVAALTPDHLVQNFNQARARHEAIKRMHDQQLKANPSYDSTTSIAPTWTSPQAVPQSTASPAWTSQQADPKTTASPAWTLPNGVPEAYRHAKTASSSTQTQSDHVDLDKPVNWAVSSAGQPVPRRSEMIGLMCTYGPIQGRWEGGTPQFQNKLKRMSYVDLIAKFYSWFPYFDAEFYFDFDLDKFVDRNPVALEVEKRKTFRAMNPTTERNNDNELEMAKVKAKERMGLIPLVPRRFEMIELMSEYGPEGCLWKETREDLSAYKYMKLRSVFDKWFPIFHGHFIYDFKSDSFAPVSSPEEEKHRRFKSREKLQKEQEERAKILERAAAVLKSPVTASEASSAAEPVAVVDLTDDQPKFNTPSRPTAVGQQNQQSMQFLSSVPSQPNNSGSLQSTVPYLGPNSSRPTRFVQQMQNVRAASAQMATMSPTGVAMYPFGAQMGVNATNPMSSKATPFVGNENTNNIQFTISQQPQQRFQVQKPMALTPRKMQRLETPTKNTKRLDYDWGNGDWKKKRKWRLICS